MGVTFSPFSVVHGCLLACALTCLLWHFRLLSAWTVVLGTFSLWLGAMQGIRYARHEAMLWQSLPDGVVAVVTGEVVTEPTLRRGHCRFVLRAEHLSTAQGAFRTPILVWVSMPIAEGERVYCGDRLRLEGRVEAPRTSGPSRSFALYLRRQGVLRTLRPHRVDNLPSRSWRVPFSRLRHRLIANLRYHLPAREGNVVAAIVLNERAGLDNTIRESFRRTGTVHILSPSGTHVTLLAAAVWAIGRWLGFPRRISSIAVLIAVWLFVSVAAGGVPAFRAAVMGTLVVGAAALQRDLDLPTSLALAACLVVQQDVGSLCDPSFQFSFILVAAIVASAGWLNVIAFGSGQKSLQPIRVGFASLCLSTVCALASAPLTALYYNQVSLIAPVANLVIALPVQMVTCCGLFIACFPAVPDFLSAPAAVSAWLIDRSVRLLAEVPWASITTPPPSRLVLLMSYALLFWCLLFANVRASRRRAVLAA